MQTRPNAFIISKPMEPRWFHFTQDTNLNWIHADVEIAPLLEKYEIPVNQVFYPADASFLPGLFRKIRLEFLSHDPHREDLLDSYMTQMLIKLSRAVHDSNVQIKVDKDIQMNIRLRRMQMLSHPEKKWTVEDLANSVSLSSSRFHVVYKSLFGVSPIRDLIEARIDRAKGLLLEEETDSLSQIAENLGYKNQYDFSRQFKQITGLSPSEFRKNNR